MSSITALVLAAFVGYGGAWYIGMVEGNFALLLFLATVVTGVYWLAERVYFLPQRKRAAEQLQVSVTQRRSELSSQGLRTDEVDLDKARNSLLLQPWWLVVFRVSLPAIWSQMQGDKPSTDSKHFAADEPSLVILTEYNPEGVCVPTSPLNTSFVCTDGSKGTLRPIVAIIMFSSLAMQFDCEICPTLKPGAETLSGAPLPAALEADSANVCIPLVAMILIAGDSCFVEGL